MGTTINDKPVFSGSFGSSDYLYAWLGSRAAGQRDAKVLCTAFQRSSANLSSLSQLALSANTLPYATGAGTLALTAFTVAGRALVDDADAAAQRTTLGFTAPILDATAPGNIGATTPGTFKGTTINATTAYQQGGTQVIGARRTGWTAWTGTATRTAVATGAATATNVAEGLKALIDDLVAHGVIGA